jgi:hypothetical protein
VANLPNRSPTVTNEVYLKFERCRSKHIFPFPVCKGQKLGDFLTNREDTPNVGQYLLITHSCFGGFFYSHKEHPRVKGAQA